MFQVLDKRQGCIGTELCISDGEHKIWTRPGTVQARTVFGHIERLTILQVKKLSFYKGWLTLDMVCLAAGYRPSKIVLVEPYITEITELSKATQESAARLYDKGRVAIFPQEAPVRSQPSSSPQYLQTSPTSFPGRSSSQLSSQLSSQHSQEPSSQPLTGGYNSIRSPSSASQPAASSPNTAHSARGTNRHTCTLWCNKTFPSKAARDYHEQLSARRGECGK